MDDEPYAVCVECEKSFTGPEPYTEHLASKAHDKKMVEKSKQLMFKPIATNVHKLHCEICDVYLSGEEPMKQHVNGNKHLSMLKKKEIMSSIEPQLDQNTTASENVLVCKVCDKCFSGPGNLKEHLNSKKHLRKVDLASMKKQINGGVAPSCPPPPTEDLPKLNIYPSLSEDYKIVHDAIQTKESTKKKKPIGCFSSVKMLFKSKNKKDKGKENHLG